jgi:hypothetical protein
MNKQTGKLLTLGGFTLSALLCLVNLFTYLLKIQFSNIISYALTALNFLSLPLIVLGFIIVFFSERKFINLLTAFMFVLCLIARILWGVTDINALAAMNNGTTIGVLVLMINALYAIAYLFWAIKLFKRAPLGGLIILASIAMSLFLPSIIARFFGPEASTLPQILLSILSASSLAIAAFIDYQN